MKIELFSYSDVGGGAAIAAYRIHKALLAYGVNSTMEVAVKLTDDYTVKGMDKKIDKLSIRARIFLASQIFRLQKTANTSGHSLQLCAGSLSKKLTSSNADIIHLNWIGGESLSIRDIGNLKGKAIWTMHDMWGFCGSEHVSSNNRFIDGYYRSNRPKGESGIDINRHMWNLKRKLWKNQIQIVTPSTWMANCVKQSLLMRDWPIKVIPNTLNTDIWAPFEMDIARKLLRLPSDCRILTFGAIGGSLSYHKGFDLLLKAFEYLKGQLQNLHIIVFGQSTPLVPLELGFPIQYVGYLKDEVSLKILYNASDLVVVPSRCDSFGQVASEAQACGVPVVAFDSTGLADIVVHKETGYLAKAFDTEDLANGIKWVLDDAELMSKLSLAAREYAVSRFSYNKVASQYVDLYSKLG